MFLSMLMMVQMHMGKRIKLKLNFLDVSRAHWHAPQRGEVYMEMPMEDPDWEEGFCAFLLKSFYGTRGAAANWEFFYAEDFI